MSKVDLLTPLTVFENDGITGSKPWDGTRTITDLNNSGWNIDQSDISKLESTGELKLFSPNGRRVIFVKILA